MPLLSSSYATLLALVVLGVRPASAVGLGIAGVDLVYWGKSRGGTPIKNRLEMLVSRLPNFRRPQ